MELLDLVARHPALLVTLTVIYSLLIGSFLNVVVYRLPIMLEREWRAQAAEILASDQPATNDVLSTPTAQQPANPPTFNLLVPRSACPNCKAPIRALQNVPVISYLFLRGRCANCRAPISPRYPLVEAFTALLSVVVVWKFGATWYSLAALAMTWALISLSLIDFDHQLLPDQITLPLVWAGLILSVFSQAGTPFAPDMRSSILGGAVGYLSLWSVYWIFKLATGKEGMGYGDFKLLAAFGTWLGWQPILLIVLLSAFAGAVIGISLIVIRGRDKNIPIPYGPYLAIAGWIAMLWGKDIIAGYLHANGIGS